MSLSYPSFYRSIHHQLGPLQKSLVASTSPVNVTRRIFEATDNDASAQKRRTSENPIYDLVYDPSNLTVRSSIPNIPYPRVPSLETTTFRGPERQSWSRVEALNVHNQILSTYTDTRYRPLEDERTCKTSRGWWLIWVRLPGRPVTPINQLLSTALPNTRGNDNDPMTARPSIFPSREAFIVHKSSDAPSLRHAYGEGSGTRFLRDLSGASTSGGGRSGGAKNLTEGLGFDAHRYIEGLLSLNR